MRTKNQVSLIHKILYGTLVLGLFFATSSFRGLSIAHAQSAATAIPTTHVLTGSTSPTPLPTPTPKSNKCYSGTGWTWTTGPAEPTTAHQAELALKKKGIDTAVTATDFGEQDSCRNFELFSVDFSLTLKDTGSFSLSAQQELSDEILTTLSQVSKPQLGNVRITFGSGNTKFYSNSKNTLSSSTQPLPLAGNSIPTKKVYLLVYDPILSNGQDFNTYMQWTPYTTLVQGIINSFQTASNGQVQYSVVSTNVVTNQWPIKIDGFRYTQATYLTAYQNRTPHNPNDVNYDVIIDNPAFDICGKLNRGEIDELWIYGGPYDGFYESRLVGPNAYWYNSPPMDSTHHCNKLLPIMGLNYERGVPEAMHSFGHRTESTMTEVYRGWQENRTAHNWDRFALDKVQSPNYAYSGCGNIHYPPNGVTDYDYGNHGTVLTNCEDFRNYPNLSNPLAVAQSVTCVQWGCDQLGYLMYWYSHLPSQAGCGSDAVSSNWWQYFADPNLALNPSLLCPPPNCPTITGWKGEYWPNQSLSGLPILCRNDSDINLDWALGSPSPVIPNDHFSARWTRTMNFTNGIYSFHIRHDDGARLYIDNLLKIDAWNTCCVWDITNVSLQTGVHTIRMEMFENSGAAHAQLWWEQEGTGIDCSQVSYIGVILYQNVTCNKDTSGNTKAFSSPTDWIDVVSDFNDITSSIYVSPGWSIKVFEKSIEQGGGSWRCITGSMWDLGIDSYANGDTERKINDDISSIQVYNQNNCLTSDTVAPNISWIAPTSNQQVYNVGNQILALEASANDNVGVSSVVFSRWDYVNLTTVNIGTAYTSSYRINFDTSTLLPDWNEVDVTAYDSAGNSASSYIWLYHTNTATTKTFSSVAAQDGWMIESNETSGVGLMLNNTALTFSVGDDALKRQYRGILSFSTGVSLPDNAIITGATLKIKKSAATAGINPLTALQGFMIDIKKGFFGTTTTLVTSDFQVATGTAGKSYGPFMPALVDNWYTIDLTGTKDYINKLSTASGLTQIRLRFKLDDNNDKIANYIMFYSGNAPAVNRPQLIIQYYVP